MSQLCGRCRLIQRVNLHSELEKNINFDKWAKITIFVNVNYVQIVQLLSDTIANRTSIAQINRQLNHTMRNQKVIRFLCQEINCLHFLRISLAAVLSFHLRKIASSLIYCKYEWKQSNLGAGIEGHSQITIVIYQTVFLVHEKRL